MEMTESLLAALMTVVQPYNIAVMFFGTLIGILVGAMPGLSSVMGLSIMMPLTLSMEGNSGVLMLLGIGILSLDGESGGLNRGDVLTLVCGVLYAAQIISVGRCNERMDTYALIVLEFAFAALTGLCWSLATERGMPIQWNMQSIGGILYVAVFSTMLASSCQNIAQKLAPTSHAALLMSLESVFGALSGVIFLGEKLTIRMGLGFLVIFAAVVLSETTASSKKFTENV